MAAPLQSPGHWVADGRGQGRGVRVSAHIEAGFLVLSTWKSGTCVSTVRLLPDEAAALVAGIADGMAQLAMSIDAPTNGDQQLTTRLTALERRLTLLESTDELAG